MPLGWQPQRITFRNLKVRRTAWSCTKTGKCHISVHFKGQMKGISLTRIARALCFNSAAESLTLKRRGAFHRAMATLAVALFTAWPVVAELTQINPPASAAAPSHAQPQAPAAETRGPSV